MDDKQAPNWGAIEIDYRAGIKPLRQLASEHGITEGAIRKRAKRDDWGRDLSAKIQAKADDLVRKEAVRAEVRAEGSAYRETEKAVVEANAEAQAIVRIAHRTDIAKTRRLVMTLLAELEAATTNQEEVERLFEVLADEVEDKDRLRRMQDALDKVMSLPGRAGTMKSLAESLGRLVTLERQAFGIADSDGMPPASPLENMTPNEAARRIAFALALGLKARNNDGDRNTDKSP